MQKIMQKITASALSLCLFFGSVRTSFAEEDNNVHQKKSTVVDETFDLTEEQERELELSLVFYDYKNGPLPAEFIDLLPPVYDRVINYLKCGAKKNKMRESLEDEKKSLLRMKEKLLKEKARFKDKKAKKKYYMLLKDINVKIACAEWFEDFLL